MPQYLPLDENHSRNPMSFYGYTKAAIEDLMDWYSKLKDFNYNEIYSLSSEKAIDKILSLSGVGPKVADCILLFGFNKNDVFPVDTWIKKVYNSYFTKEKTDNVKEIRKNLVKMFGDLSGYAQQYLFYYKRSFEKYILN